MRRQFVGSRRSKHEDVLCPTAMGVVRIRSVGGKIVGVDLLSRRCVGGSSRLPSNPVIVRAVACLKRYAERGCEPFLAPKDFDFSGLTPFTRAVVLATRRIPRGRMRTYSGFTRAIGRSPRYRRAAAGALGRNPFPIFFPCHRIVAANGWGGFSGAPGWKKRLLAHEGITAPC